MFKKLVSFAAAAALIAAVSSAQAMPVSGLEGAASPHVTLVFGGCGPLGHRGPYGHCRAGGQFGGYGRGRACPPGFHLGPRGAHCWPN